MRRLLITFAALTLPAIAALSAAEPAAAATAPAYAPGQVVVKFDRQGPGRAVDVPAGVGVGEATAALRDNPHVDYAVPNYIAVASAAIPNDPGTVPGKPGPAGGWVRKQWNFLPCGSLCDPQARKDEFQSRGGIDAIGAWHNLQHVGRAGAKGVRIAVLDTGIAYRNYSSPQGRFRRSPDFVRKQLR